MNAKTLHSLQLTRICPNIYQLIHISEKHNKIYLFILERNFIVSELFLVGSYEGLPILMCAKQRFRSSLWRYLDSQRYKGSSDGQQRLIRQFSCADWSETSLGATSNIQLYYGRSETLWVCPFPLTSYIRLSQLRNICFYCELQLNLVISTSVISNNRLSRSENLVPA